MKKSVSKYIGQAALILLMMAVGAACGVLIGKFMKEELAVSSGAQGLVWYALFIVAVYLAMGIQIVVHEAGHLVFGLLTGYKFVSFRIGSLMLVRENGRLARKKFSLAGTGGQCLMAPPELVDGKMPVVLYNLGGSILNLAAAAVCIGLYAFCRPVPLLSAFFAVMAVCGVGSALMNGVPFVTNAVPNDGHNTLSLCRDPQATRAFWIQMKISELTSHGTRQKDMPAEWFALPEGADLNNPLVAAVAVMACSRLLDEHRAEEAAQEIDRLFAQNAALPGIYRAQLVCDRAFCELIGPNDPAVVQKLLDKPQRKMMKAMKTLPNIVRTQYAIALLHEHDENKAASLLDSFEKIAKTYPYPADIASERELIALARSRAETLNTPA